MMLCLKYSKKYSERLCLVLAGTEQESDRREPPICIGRIQR